MTQKRYILGISVRNRQEDAFRVQQILTKYGCSIKTRLGLHDESDAAAIEGLILLEMTGDSNEILKLENELNQIPEVQVKKMVFEVHS